MPLTKTQLSAKEVGSYLRQSLKIVSLFIAFFQSLSEGKESSATGEQLCENFYDWFFSVFSLAANQREWQYLAEIIQLFDALQEVAPQMHGMFTWRKRKPAANSAKHLAELYGLLLRREPAIDDQILHILLASLARLVQFDDIRLFMSRVSFLL